MRTLGVAPRRWERWVANFETQHPGTRLSVEDGALCAHADDGSWFRARLPFAAAYDAGPDPTAFAAAAAVPDTWGVLLVRKGGFALARLEGSRLLASKVGQRHVQGRTKAGGQSQQRFARRRDNQARAAYDAATGHALTVLGSAPLDLITGGDRAAVDGVLEDPGLRAHRVMPRWFAVPDPRRRVLEDVIARASEIQVEIVDTQRGDSD